MQLFARNDFEKRKKIVKYTAHSSRNIAIISELKYKLLQDSTGSTDLAPYNF